MSVSENSALRTSVYKDGVSGSAAYAYMADGTGWIFTFANRTTTARISPLAGLDLGLLDPFVQRVRRKADLARNRHHRRSIRRVLTLMFQNQPHRPDTNHSGKLLYRMAHQTFFSGEKVSANPGAVHSPAGALVV
ncbi:hypothetical protein BAR24_14185 [Gluconobacter oxydans]|nr:hypothetical protein B932_2357 [Gluconobacter oxydans H24]ANQ42500.1 hypothetical protein BAR24_14185 [Gluconobacter oxydans]